jgi:hypothetical protein
MSWMKEIVSPHLSTSLAKRPFFRQHDIEAFPAVLVSNGIDRGRELAAPGIDLISVEARFDRIR